MSGAADVRVEGLARVYDEHYALVDLTADFPQGTVTALLGPNGAGKSTLMGILSSLQAPNEGRVLMGGVPVKGADPRVRSRIAYVGHQTMLYGTLTARENLAFYARLYGLSDAAARADRLLDEVGLPDDKDRPVSGFSRGMAQRLTLARALLPDPTLLLLDEPLTGLDQDGVALALALIERRKQAGTVVVMASHDLVATGRVADRVLLLRRGRKVYEGPIEGDLAVQYQVRLEAA